MQTVICAFDDAQTAQRAKERLLSAGFSHDDVHIQSGTDAGSYAGSDTSSTSATSSLSTPGSMSTDSSYGSQSNSQNNGGFLSSVGNFFSDLFGGDSASNEAGTYSEAVRRGNTVVVVDAANEVEAERAADIMDELGAIDINERASQWKSAGWTGFDSSAQPLSRDEIVADRSTMPAVTQQVAQPALQTGSTLNVVQEELQVGKRNVDKGGVRVIQRVSETPVREMINLREERAVIERRPVDRVATQAELGTFEEGTIEVRESAEEAVVAKTARVVEEVVVGKDVQERTETINETVRRKDVDVERFEGQTASSNRVNQDHAFASDKPTSDKSVLGDLRDGAVDLKNDILNKPSNRNS